MKEDVTKITIKGGSIDITCAYSTEEIEGGYICYIPAFDIYFYVKDYEESSEKAIAMIKSFHKFWITKLNWKQYILEIHKLGFRAPNHNFVMKQLLNHRISDTQLKSDLLVPEGSTEISTEIAA